LEIGDPAKEAAMAHAVARKHGIEALVVSVRREFEEMPGLTLTAAQARRLWALEPRRCRAVLDRLVETGYLCQTETGRYAKPGVL